MACSEAFGSTSVAPYYSWVAFEKDPEKSGFQLIWMYDKWCCLLSA
ncbi:hypothetical protein ALQ07_101844 [Pseudomonas syringae pv. actinidiae]|uniref:Predicted nuclease n=2 Tax=Pseudomonas syringae TaxID=317 RepID=A0A2V0QXN1_PSESF|nr:hypothetical protein ALQ07_101844 [Pseudomonas syringae pv. actinidiae]RMT74839.1 hypothetical protein ALP44_101701 [Pseudomonas syringae pv. theae]GBH17856.1 Predicted nuclease [Pseudomonas syringae pv. actinidiae]